MRSVYAPYGDDGWSFVIEGGLEYTVDDVDRALDLVQTPSDQWTMLQIERELTEALHRLWPEDRAAVEVKPPQLGDGEVLAGHRGECMFRCVRWRADDPNGPAEARRPINEWVPIPPHVRYSPESRYDGGDGYLYSDDCWGCCPADLLGVMLTQDDLMPDDR